MNIDDLTYGEIKKIAALVGCAQTAAEKKEHAFAGKHVIIRTYSAGVHAGVLVSQDGDEVYLKNSRRLWSWNAKDGIALSGVAVHGIKSGCKVDVLLPELFLTGAIETIPTSANAQASIENA